MKPSIQKITWFAAALWIGLALCFYFFETIDVIFYVAFLVSALIFLLCAIFRKSGSIAHVFTFVSLGILSSLLLYGFCSDNYQQQKNELANQSKTKSVFYIEEDSSSGSYSNSCLSKMILDNGEQIKVKLYFDQDTNFYYGETITANYELKTIKSTECQSYFKKGIVGKLYINNFSNSEEQNILISNLSGLRKSFINTVLNDESQSEESLLFCALSCGYRSKLFDTSLYSDFKHAGLAHMVAISGAHLSIVVSMLSLLLKALKIKKKTTISIEIVFLLLYVFVSAMPISALRAAFMCSAAIVSYFAKRRSAAQNALSCVIVVFLVLNPFSALSLSFALSSLSTAGIIFFYQLFRSVFSKQKGKICSAVCDSFALSLSANSFVLPMSVAVFSYLSPVTIISNFVASYFLTVICVLGILAFVAFSFSSSIFSLMATFSIPLCKLFADEVSYFASLPFASYPASLNYVEAAFITALIFALLYIFWNRITLSRLFCFGAGVLIFYACFVGYASLFGETRIVMFDVGQGDSFLIKSKNENVLIDTGNSDTKLLSSLSENGVSHLDGLIITHPDDDHCASLEALVDVVDIDTIFLSVGVRSCSCSNCTNLVLLSEKASNEICYVSPGDILSLGCVDISILWPYEFSCDGGNDDSICALVRIDANSDETHDYSALFCGDAESEVIDELISLDVVSEIDILKVSHHGSSGSCSEEILHELKPKIALISVGAQNKYGHPSYETLELLANSAVKVFRSDEMGEVSCTFSSLGISVQANR
jgi:competence protein ComEC